MTHTQSSPITYFGHTHIEHTLSVAWDPFTNPEGETFELFAREIIPPGGENYPYLVYLQGGPGFPSPRPTSVGSWMGPALKKYRLLLLDQRGTGRSARIDAVSERISTQQLALLRQEYIVEDAEALRRALGVEKWSLFGQSFGGFCITSYLSAHPESVDTAYLTGGLPTLDKTADDLYRSTYAKLEYRHEQFLKQVPFADARIREIAHHLDNAEELLPTGERLSSRRFRTIGINLGRGTGFLNLAYLLEDPFRIVRGEKRMKTDVLHALGAQLSFGAAPLYAAIHESIYGGVGMPAADLGQRSATRWAADRMREEVEGFAENADPVRADKFYLTGEHIYPWQFDEDPALRPFKDAAMGLAEHHWQRSPYDAAGLAQAPTVAAAVYLDDIFVPFEESMATARTYRDLRLHVTNYFQHDGIGHDGAGIFELLDAAIADH
ncbi:alpha/beta fold hydrolase [Corynebacterium felinum]|uniref:Pimeloyl-ACP methyl ester carboxylesterase n=1 Tax=Corynebacterium felinum TaxID=131318 RepID=A0ABU2B537_9CORY|nr:alpha/beta fold hydrolase [Corynebacterium felinum]MDF5821400.1 alpha/beta fold hydrolase [Corynebacterium felinum]MDR7353511.1 pimeloyl-ACP methyl ester carboxylesterase [Corynebacterium felinum]WJY95690.1 Proline iminopeptidase [Corynebacterium felinum]